MPAPAGERTSRTVKALTKTCTVKLEAPVYKSNCTDCSDSSICRTSGCGSRAASVAPAGKEPLQRLWRQRPLHQRQSACKDCDSGGLCERSRCKDCDKDKLPDRERESQTERERERQRVLTVSEFLCL